MLKIAGGIAIAIAFFLGTLEPETRIVPQETREVGIETSMVQRVIEQ
jgi:hypothetical protein